MKMYTFFCEALQFKELQENGVTGNLHVTESYRAMPFYLYIFSFTSFVTFSRPRAEIISVRHAGEVTQRYSLFLQV